MTLATHHWGSGEKCAVLIHGLYNLGVAWHATAAELVTRGYRVIAVDLPGHGLSPRAPQYPASALRQAVVNAVPHAPDLVIGHSLGAFTARLTAPLLQPARVVYVDPAFDIMEGTWEQREEARLRFAGWIALTESGVRESNPTWSDADVHIELLGRALFDPDFLQIFHDDSYVELPEPTDAAVLVVKGEHDSAVLPEREQALRAEGATIRVVPGTGHNLNRDDHAGFLTAIDDWMTPLT